MPLEQFAQTLAALRAEEDERIRRQQQEAQQLQTSPGMIQAGMSGPILDENTKAQVQQFLTENPPPKPGALMTISNVLRRLGARMEGKQVPDWVTPDDPLAKFRDNMAMEIARQGMGRGMERMKEEGRNKRQDKEIKARRDLKSIPEAMHPAEEAYKQSLTLSPEEQQYRGVKSGYEAMEAGQRARRTEGIWPLEQQIIRDEMAERGQGGQPAPIQQPTPSPQPQEDSIDAILANNTPEQAIAILQAKGYPINTTTVGEGQFGSVESDMSSTAEAPVRPTQPSNVQQMLQRNDPLNKMRRKQTISMGPQGTTITSEKVLTPEAELARKRQEAQITHETGAIPVETQTRLKNNFDAYDILQNIKTLYNPDNIGPIVNAMAAWQKYGGTLPREHQAMRAEIMNLTNLLFHVRTGAAGPENEQYVQEQIAPDLYSGNPAYFLDALKRLEEMVTSGINNDVALSGTTRGDLPGLAKQRMQQYKERRPPSQAYQQAAEPPRPQGMPSNFQYNAAKKRWEAR